MEKSQRDAIERGNRNNFSHASRLQHGIVDGCETRKLRSKYALPEDFNVLQDTNGDVVMITVGFRQDDILLEVGSNKTKMFYDDHPLDLGFTFTG